MDKQELMKKASAWLRRLGAYKYVLLVIAAGLVLLLWPDGTTGEEYAAEGGTELFDLEEMQHELEEILGRIEGAGKVSVMLTIKTGTERILAQNATYSEEKEQTETVTISVGSGQQETVTVARNGPVFQGALVVCPGGADPQVKLAITQAVSALTGLGTARITVCRGD